MPGIDAFADRLSSYLGPDQVNLVRRAYYYAEQAHDGQRRRSGEPYVTHPLAVSNILADMHMDHQSLMAAMLHDVIEDTGIAKEALTAQFGETVSELVDGVSKLTQMNFETKAEAQAENFQKMAMAMARDIRVILVKLADRLHNMRTLEVLSGEKRRRIAKETLEIYAPIANRLGMHTMRVEFEDLGFKAMHPMRAERIRQAVKKARGNRREIVGKIQESLVNCLAREGMEGQVIGREKHLYSIYQKMRGKRKAFNEIMDVYAFRIIVDKVDTCYRVLGAVHSLYKPFPGRFKDYIAIPKANGYQSLHTTLFGMHGVPIEIQIRTREMEEMANHGIAAHWLYKSNDETPKGTHARARQWVKGVLELQQRAGNSLEFIENVKIDLFPDEVYVFTPKGRIMELPKGSTAVDFAYAVHTDVGNSCIACRINRRLAPLSEPLQSGQTVEIVTAPGARPNPAWLSFVVTGKARTHIRHALKLQRRSESINLGERLLNKTLTGFDSHLEKIPPGTHPGRARRVPHGSLRGPAGRDRPGQPHGLRGRPPPAVQRGRGSAKRRGSAGDPRHRRPGPELRQVLHADSRRPDRWPPVRRQGHGGAPGKLQEHQRSTPQPGKMHPAQLGQGCHRRIQCRTTRRAGAPAWPDRPARHQRQRGRRQHREDQHGRARRSHQRGPAGRQRARSRPPGPRHQEAARPQGSDPDHPPA